MSDTKPRGYYTDKVFTKADVDRAFSSGLAEGKKLAIEAPAAPVQEPDEWLTGCPECGMDSGCDCDSGTWNPPAAPVQNLQCFHCQDTIETLNDKVMHLMAQLPVAKPHKWVGLTPDDIRLLEKENTVGGLHGDYCPTWDLIEAVEAKLREKNSL
jgi:hypothetical protein